MALPLILAGVLISSAVLLAALHLPFRAPMDPVIALRGIRSRSTQRSRLVSRLAINALVSVLAVFALFLGLRHRLLYAGTPPWWQLGIESIAVLVLYDFLYYALHRFGFHGPLRSIHTMHHVARHPRAIDSLFVHPLETLLGLVALAICLAAVGPVSTATFAIVLFVFTHMNIIIHAGLPFRSPWLAPLAYMIRKHDVHHADMRAGNFASITPLPDLVFGSDD